MRTELSNRKHGVVTSHVLPGWMVAGPHSIKGHVSGRVAMVGIEGGVLVDLDDGRIAGFNADDARRLSVIREVDTPYDVSDHGDLWLAGWNHVVGSNARC